MNIQEILNMVDEDIARAEEQQPDNKEENIDFCCPNWKHPVNWTRTGLRKIPGHAHYVSIPYPTG